VVAVRLCKFLVQKNDAKAPRKMLVRLIPCEKYVTEIADFKGMRLHYVIQGMPDTEKAISEKL